MFQISFSRAPLGPRSALWELTMLPKPCSHVASYHFPQWLPSLLKIPKSSGEEQGRMQGGKNSASGGFVS